MSRKAGVDPVVSEFFEAIYELDLSKLKQCLIRMVILLTRLKGITALFNCRCRSGERSEEPVFN